MKARVLIFLALMVVAGLVSAQATKSTNSPAQLPKELSEKIASSDPAVRAAAVEEVRRQMANPANIIGPLAQLYLPAMRKVGLNQEAAEWAMQAVLTAPSDAGTLERLHTQRIEALLALKQPDEALVEAKSLYNICSMKGTGDALLLFAECLQVAHPDDKALAERFKAEQLTGSMNSPQAGSTGSPQVGATTQPSTQPAGSTPSINSGQAGSPQAEVGVLKGIKVDGEVYRDVAISPQLATDTYINLVRRGNLWLEADALPRARECFEAAYKIAPEAEQGRAAESLARVMKAEDGTVGRANAFVLSLRANAATLSR